MTLTTTTEIDAAVNNYYDRKLLKKAVPRFVYQNWAQTRDIPRNNSNVIKFRKYSLLASATTPLTEGTTPNGSQLSKTDLTATVNQYGKGIIAVLKSSLISLIQKYQIAL